MCKFFGLSVLSCAAIICGCTQVEAATLADVQIVERLSGKVLPIYRHRGEYWVAGRAGANYAVRINNRMGSRIMAVISVDGVNAINGKTASAKPEDGYVLDAGSNYDITGWRKSDEKVAAFYFSYKEASYASRTGRPQDIGVIGVALFNEQVQQAAGPVYEDRGDYAARDERMNSAPAARSADAEAAAPNAKPSLSDRSAKSSAQSAQRAPSLGTGHGSVESSQVWSTEFTSATPLPAQVVRIRYDSYDNLVAKGVIPQPKPRPVVPHSPNPFPADGGYVPDPPSWR